MSPNLESYPPPFRGLIDQVPSLRHDSDSNDVVFYPIPVVDFQGLFSQDEDYNKVKLVEACKNWGVFRLVNHGIPQNLMSQLMDSSREILSLSFEAKKGLFSTTPLSYFWGTPALTPSGAALSKGPQNFSWFEGLNVPLSQLSQLHEENSCLDSFRFVLEEYGKHLIRIARVLFEPMWEKLNLDILESKSNLSESTGFLRVYRYPRCFDDDNNNGEPTPMGMDAHTDSSVLSILNQDQVSGLEILKDDCWLGVEPIPDTLIVNLGDMMQAISDDKYKSVKHRVKVNKGKERMSVCYFVFPGEGRVVRSSKYKPFTYTDFQAQVQRDVKALGYKVGLERFKLN